MELTNAAGCSVISEIVEVNVTHNDALNPQKILVYPQPALGNILNFSLVEHYDNATVSIFSLDGRLIKYQIVKIDETGYFSIDISDLNVGIYFTEIRLMNHNIIIRWLKTSQ